MLLVRGRTPLYWYTECSHKIDRVKIRIVGYMLPAFGAAGTGRIAGATAKLDAKKRLAELGRRWAPPPG